MRKLLAFTCTLVLAFTSCSKNIETEVADQSYIGFSSFIGNSATRASIANTSTVATDGFGVFAYYTESKDFVAVGGESVAASLPNFMFNQFVYSEDKGQTWTYSPKKYWSNNPADNFSFFAYAPYGNENITISSVNNFAGTPFAHFTVPTEVKSQIDFLVAIPQINITKPVITSPVSFSFKHALSRIGFKVKTEGISHEDNATTVTINQVDLLGTFASKDIKVNLEASEDKNITWFLKELSDINFVNEYSLNEDNFISTIVTESAEQLNTEDSFLMIIPQTVSDLKLKVDYTVTTLDSAIEGGKVIENNIIEVPVGEFLFAAGKAYSFTLKLTLDEVELSAHVDEWDTTHDEYSTEIKINQ